MMNGDLTLNQKEAVRLSLIIQVICNIEYNGKGIINIAKDNFASCIKVNVTIPGGR